MTTKVWGRMLREAVERKGLNWHIVMRETGLSLSNLYKMRQGDRLVTLEVAQQLADALDMPTLSLAVLEMRTKQCEVCHAWFVDRGRSHDARTCSTPCLTARRQRDARRMTAEARERQHLVMKRRMERYTLAVMAFCRACEPEGMCRNRSCELRDVSPLPLKKSSAR